MHTPAPAWLCLGLGVHTTWDGQQHWPRWKPTVSYTPVGGRQVLSTVAVRQTLISEITENEKHVSSNQGKTVTGHLHLSLGFTDQVANLLSFPLLSFCASQNKISEQVFCNKACWLHFSCRGIHLFFQLLDFPLSVLVHGLPVFSGRAEEWVKSF